MPNGRPKLILIIFDFTFLSFVGGLCADEKFHVIFLEGEIFNIAKGIFFQPSCFLVFLWLLVNMQDDIKQNIQIAVLRNLKI